MTVTAMKEQITALTREKGLDHPPKILFAAAECSPLAKTGGLADVVGTLPKYLKKLGFDARVMIPYHRIIKEKYGDQVQYLFSFDVHMGWRTKFVGVNRLMLGKVCIWLIENEEYFGESIYLHDREGEQYAFFTRAVLEALPQLDFIPDVIHCNDWHTGMLPFLLKTQYYNSPLARTKTLLTIHNIAYQGLCKFDFVQDFLSVPEGCFGLMERFGMADFLKAGCIMADRVNTVSPSYAREICTPEYGEGLDGVLDFRGDVTGIVNGIDKSVWNPGKDGNLPVNFTRAKMVGKIQCKTALLEELGLEIIPTRPLIGMVTRLAEQKGIELIMEAMDKLLWENDFSFVLLGNGAPKYEKWLQGLEARHPGRACAWIGYADGLSHRIYAGCDFFLMPSRFEPCGISQMIAMAYGTLPIVRETGGLKDTVQSYNQYTGEGTGFSFARMDAGDMSDAILRALAVYKDKETMASLVQQAMEVDNSCNKWAYTYGELYLSMM
ncbi:MAG: glycogen synthase [Oscillospiraceae bacterium]|nr:glycogen synthase [Oscillospiraceae bacterium]